MDNKIQIILNKRKDIDGISYNNNVILRNKSKNKNIIEIMDNNKKESIICLIACHFCSKTIKQMVLLNNLYYTYHNFDKVIVIYSSDIDVTLFINSTKKIFKNIDFIKTNNTNLFDFGKWLIYLKDLDKAYDKYCLTNESFIIIRNIDDFFYFCRNKDVEMMSYLDSYEVKYHYQSWLRIYNKSGIDKLSSHIELYKSAIKNQRDVILRFELCLDIFETKDCYYKMPKDYKMNLNFDLNNLQKYIQEYGYSIIKIKPFNFFKKKNLEKYIPKEIYDLLS